MKKCSQYVLKFRFRLAMTEFLVRAHFDAGSRRGLEAGSLKALLVEAREYLRSERTRFVWGCKSLVIRAPQFLSGNLTWISWTNGTLLGRKGLMLVQLVRWQMYLGWRWQFSGVKRPLFWHFSTTCRTGVNMINYKSHKYVAKTHHVSCCSLFEFMNKFSYT